MPASALLKFAQGATVGGDGRALVGVLGTSVTISNVNNTSVQSWQIDLAYVDPTSALVISTPYASNDSSSTPSATFTPDVRRSYRWVLKVWSVPNRVGQPDSVDIRIFSVRELNGVIIPPSSLWPLPLPDPRTGDPAAKPLENNYDGQIDGWHGTGSDGQMSQVLAKHIPPLPGSNGDVLTVVAGRWTSAAPAAGGTGDVNGPVTSVAGNIAIFSDTTGNNLADSGVAPAAFIRKDGTVTYTGSQSMGGFKLTNLANGTVSTDAVNLGQLQAAVNGLDPKGNVRAYTTTNISSLSGLGPLAGSGISSFTDNQRIGLGGQTNPIENGLYNVHSGAWTRTADMPAGSDASGAFFFVDQGTFAEHGFLVSTDEGSATVGTNGLTLVDFGTSSVAAGNGLQKIGNTLSVLADGSTITVSVLGIKVSTGGITGNELAVGAVDLASNKITGLLPFANLANGAANSVLGRNTNTSGVMASIAASADGQVLRLAAGVLGFGALDLSDPDAVAGSLPLGNLPSIAGLSVLGRAPNTTGVVAAITGTTDQALRVDGTGTTLGFGQLATGAYANSSVTLAKIANGTASSVLGRSPATSGAYADITSSADGQVLRRGASGVIAFGAVDLADTDAVTNLLPFSNIANGAATSVLGRSAGTAGVMASIAAAVDGHVLQRVAGSLVFAAVGAGGLAGGTAVGQVLTNAVGNVPTWGAVDLADTDAVTNQLPLANVASIAGLSVLGRGGNTTGVMAAITGVTDQVLRVDSLGTTLAFGQIATGGIADGAVTPAKLSNGTAASLFGRSAATGGLYADIVSSADGQVLVRAAGVLVFGAVDLADSDAVTGLLPFANLANGGATSVLARSANSVGVMSPLSASADGQILQRVAGALTWGAVPSASLAGGTAVGQVLINALGNVPTWGAVDLADVDAVTGLLPLANIASIAGLSVLGRSASTTGAMAAITAATDGHALRRSGAAVGFGQLATAAYTDASVTLAKLANGTASSLLGRAGTLTGPYADIASTADGQVLTRVAGTLVFGAVDLADTDAVTGKLAYANLADGSAASVLARPAATPGVLSSLASTADGQVLQRAAGALSWTTLNVGTLGGGIAVGQVLINTTGNVPAWGAVDLADADAVTGILPFANMPVLAGLSVVGRTPSTSGVMAAITAGTDGHVLRRNGTALSFGTLAAGAYADGTITVAKLSNASASSVLGRSAATAGAYADIVSSADGQVLRRGAGGVVAFGALDLADADAVTGLLPGTNVSPNFGSQNIVSTGMLTIGSSGVDSIRMPNNSSIYGMKADGVTPVSIAYVSTGGGVQYGATSATNLGLVSSSASLSLGFNVLQLENGISQLRFIASQATTVNIFHDTISTPGVNGQTMIVHAQNAAGAGATGGELWLASGTGAAGAGALRLYAGSANNLTVFPLSVDLSAPSLAFQSTVSSPSLVHNSSSTANLTGGTFLVGAQNRTGAGVTGGEELEMHSGHGSVIGKLTLRAGDVTLSGNRVVLQATDLGSFPSNRIVLGLLGAVTSSQMPANTGDGVLYVANATGIPTTGNPSNGYELFGDATGFYVRGPSGNVTQLGQP